MADHGARAHAKGAKPSPVEKTYQISFSGGTASAVSAILAYWLDLKFELIFADTLVEDADLYRFNNEVAEFVGKKIVHLKDGRNPWQVFIDDRKMGNSRNANCSKYLKTNVVKKYLEWNSEPTDPLVLGMDLFESDRLERAQAKWAPRPVISLLIQHKVAPGSYDSILKKAGIRRPRLYDMGFPHNNCGGMCVKAGLKQFATLLEQNPDYYRWCEKQEDAAHFQIPGKVYPFIRDRRGGETKYMTMREFRIEYQAGRMPVEPYDYGGCGCFIND